MLHYLHVGERRAAFELAIVKLDEALTIVLHLSDEDHATLVGPARVAIDEYLWRTPIDTQSQPVEPPPAPDPALLARRGIEVDAQRFRAGVNQLADRRRALRALVEAYGWRWTRDVCGDG